MIRFGICDDDIKYIESVESIICESFKQQDIFQEECQCILYSSGKELIERFIQDEIDIFFIDIECGEMSGFDIARQILKRKKNSGIVYITNYQNYVFESYVCRPLGFIRKSFIKSDINISMINIVEYLENKRNIIVFEGVKGNITLYMNDIVAVEVYDHKLKIILNDREVECNGSLAHYEKELEKHGFIKITRSIEVNKRYITGINADRLCLCGRIEYIISRRRVKAVRESWGKAEEY